MNSKKKGLLIAALILLSTLGIFAIKNYVIYANKGFYYGNPADLFLLLPLLPFAPLLTLFDNPGTTEAAIIFLVATIFWLMVGYFIGYLIDKKQAKLKTK